LQANNKKIAQFIEVYIRNSEENIYIRNCKKN